MRSARDFFKPLAIGAPEPLREIPFRPSRMIHFFDPSNPKMVSKLPELARQCDVLLGNLEDAIAADKKVDAREGLVRIAREVDFGKCQLWTRVNSLDSPWMLDDLTRLVTEIGDRIDVVMVPKVEGPWDIHYMDQLLALLEAKHAIKKPILLHAILETAEGMTNVEAICGASPRMHGISLGPADMAASRKMKTTRVGGGHPGYRVIEDPRSDGAARAILAAYPQNPPKMIGVSASAFEPDREACLAAGCAEFLAKPFREEQLFAALERQLGLKWHYAETVRPDTAAPFPTVQHAPEPADAETLFELASKGDVVGVRAYAQQLAERDPRLGAFAQAIAELAGRFKMKGIRQFVDRYRAAAKTDS